ncbi:MAG: ATP-binding protein [Gammaproteobacteria bacterium]|nr:ATP-binding protein [Gammaproteobacteria bacterium]MDH5727979.1 ATP-binding protein [Gammaproteobacteria bacterium]
MVLKIEKLHRYYLFVWLQLVMAIIAIGFIAKLQADMEMSMAKNSTLVLESHEVANKLTLAHLWLEEVMRGQPDIDLEKNVFGEFDAAYKILLKIKMTITPPDSQTKHADMVLAATELEKQFDQLKQLTLTRIRHGRDGTLADDIQLDLVFNQVFNTAMNRSNQLTDLLEMHFRKHQSVMQQQHHYGIYMLVFIFGLQLLLSFIYRRVLDQRNSELQISEKTSKAIVDTAVDGIMITDLRGYIVRLNPAAAAIFQYDVGSLIGRSVSVIIPRPIAEKHEQLMSHFKGLSMPGVVGISREVTGMRQDGSQVPVEIAISEFDINGERFFSAIIRDITFRKKMEGDLILARKQAETADRVKSEFLDNMGHELRTPMNGIIGMLELLQATEVDEKQQDYLKVAISASNTLESLLNDILDFTRLDSDRFEIENLQFDINQLCKEIGNFFAVQAIAKGLAIEFEFDTAIPAQLWGDPIRIRQILNHLMANAIKFTDTGKVCLSSEILTDDVDELYIRIAVKDTGAGINESLRLSIFEAFTQVDGSITRRHGGTGLGLAISQKLAQIMRGSIGVQSEVGEGSKFWLDLPLAKSNSSRDSNQNLAS